MAKLRLLRQGGFVFLTLDDAPTRNALSAQMLLDFPVAVPEAWLKRYDLG